MTANETAQNELIRSIEERAFRALPALETERVGGWVFHYANGHTKRANSANALMPSVPFAETFESARIFFAARKQRLCFRLSDLAASAIDTVLAERGLEVRDPSHVMTLSLDGSWRMDSSTVIHETAAQGWGAGFAEIDDTPQDKRPTQDRILAAIKPPSAFAMIVEHGNVMSYGRAVLDEGMIGVFDVVTVPVARRCGIGRRLTESLLAWGQAQGAATAYLQVIAANAPACALYRKLGFTTLYDYHYRVQVGYKNSQVVATHETRC